MRPRLTDWMILIVMLFTACSSSDQPGYTVLFDQPVLISHNIVSHKGTPIGKVQQMPSDFLHTSQVSVEIDPDQKALLGQHIVFVLIDGSLELTAIAPYGEPLASDAVLAGFASKSDLLLFRLKNLFSNKALAARHRAENLANNLAVRN